MLGEPLKLLLADGDSLLADVGLCYVPKTHRSCAPVAFVLSSSGSIFMQLTNPLQQMLLNCCVCLVSLLLHIGNLFNQILVQTDKHGIRVAIWLFFLF